MRKAKEPLIISIEARRKHSSKSRAAVSSSLEIWALVGDFSSFSLLYSVADAPDAPAYFAAELFDLLEHHASKVVRNCELAIWADVMPLDSKRWMFYVTSERLSDDILAPLAGLARGTNGWCPVGRVPTLPSGSVPLYEYEKGTRNLLLSDVLIGESKKALAHPVVSHGKEGLSLSFGVFPDGYLNENKLYLGTGGGICFKTKSAQGLRPKKVYCLLAEGGEKPTKQEPAYGAPNPGLKLVDT